MKVGDLCQYLSRTVLVLEVRKIRHDLIEVDVQELGAEIENSFRTIYNGNKWMDVIQSAEQK